MFRLFLKKGGPNSINSRAQEPGSSRVGSQTALSICTEFFVSSPPGPFSAIVDLRCLLHAVPQPRLHRSAYWGVPQVAPILFLPSSSLHILLTSLLIPLHRPWSSMLSQTLAILVFLAEFTHILWTGSSNSLIKIFNKLSPPSKPWGILLKHLPATMEMCCHLFISSITFGLWF